MPVHDDPTGQVTDLVASLIRNACVNDGTPTSGHEHRSAELLEAVLAGPGLDIQRFEPTPGRTSLVARIEGRDPTAPTLVLLGHTDVVPVNPERWHEDPFAPEVIDGVLWGRGAIDMLNLTGSMALATRRLADRGFRPRGTLVYVAVADEEALGDHGAGWLTAHEWDAVGGHYVITESGGVPTPTPAGTRLGITVGEKGAMWCKLVVRGTSGHASRPLRTDNALVKAAEVVRRISGFQAPVQIGEEWRRYVEEMGFSRDLASALVDPERLDATVAELPQLGLARQAHACTRTTMSPTVIRGGTKTNVIPDRVDVEIDIRSLPGQTADDVRAIIGSAVGDLAPDVHIDWVIDDPASASPMHTPLWEALEQITARLAPQARCVPTLTAGATDARFYRRRGAVAYGFGLFSGRLSLEDMASMFHGDNERIDLESLRLSTELWESLAAEFLA